MIPKIIALCAPKPQSGKDTIAAQIKGELTENGHKVLTIAFADALRHNVASLFGNDKYPMIMERLHCAAKDIPIAELAIDCVKYDDYRSFLQSLGKDPEQPRSPRWHMQKFGDEHIKEYLGMDDHWVSIVDREIHGFKGYNFDYVIITDARSEVEFEYLDAVGATVIQVEPVFFPERKAVSEHMHPVEQFDYSDYVSFTVRNVWGRPETAMEDFRMHFP